MPAEAAPVDPVALTAALIRCPSVTPAEGGALLLLERLLAGAGFACTRVDRGGDRRTFTRAGGEGGEPEFRLQRAYRCGAGGRCGGLDARSLRWRDRGRLAVGAGRDAT